MDTAPKDLGIKDLVTYCSLKNITTIKQLTSSPKHIRLLMKRPGFRSKVARILYRRRMKSKEKGSHATRIYANEEEKDEMNECHLASVVELGGFIAIFSPY